MRDRIAERPLTGHGYGKEILGPELATTLGDPTLTHAHNVFASVWLQTGAIGLALFVAVLVAAAWRFAGYARSRDDTLALVGVVGLAILAGVLVKNLTDDFFVRTNARFLWADGGAAGRVRRAAAARRARLAAPRRRAARSGAGARASSAGTGAGIGLTGAPAGGAYSGIQVCSRARTSASVGRAVALAQRDHLADRVAVRLARARDVAASGAASAASLSSDASGSS